jgi:transcriptional regulator with XRE-family HTH domain
MGKKNKALKESDIGKQLDPRIPQDKILTLRYQHNLSYAAIGEQLGCSKSYVAKVLKKFEGLMESPETLEHFRRVRPDLLTAAEFKILRNLVNDTKLKEASANNLAYAFQQIHSARRIEEGLGASDVNINIVNILNEGLRDGKPGQQEPETVDAELIKDQKVIEEIK